MPNCWARASPKPTPSACNCQASFRSNHRFWRIALDNSEFAADLVIPCAFALNEMSAKPFSQPVRVGPIVVRELSYLFLHGSPCPIGANSSREEGMNYI